MAFLRQSWRSNYCGVYAAGMFLSLLGRQVDRIEARLLFCLKATNGDYQGATPLEVSRALRRSGAITRARWKFFRRFSLKAIRKSLAGTSNRGRIPSILYFGIVHRRRGLRAMHFAVVTDIGRFGLRLLDPLGGYPSDAGYNVLLIADGDKVKPLEIIGSAYLVDEDVEAAILQW